VELVTEGKILLGRHLLRKVNKTTKGAQGSPDERYRCNSISIAEQTPPPGNHDHSARPSAFLR